MKISIALLLLIQSFCCFSNAFPDMNKIYRIDELLRFEYRAMTRYQVLDKEDFQSIHSYYDLLFNIEVQNQTLDRKDEISFLFFHKILKTALIEDKIPKEYMPKLMKFAVALNGFKNSQGYRFNTLGLIWYLEYRSIIDVNESDLFLEKALITSSKSSHKKIFKLLKVDSKYQLIEKWFNKEKTDNYSQLIRLLKRQNKINDVLNHNDEKSFTLLIDDYILTINQIFSEIKAYETNYGALELLFEHNEWLFLQMHKHKENAMIKQFLKDIFEDWLILNGDSLIKDLPSQNKLGSRYDILNWINKKLDIYRKIMEINGLILIPSAYPETEHERKVSDKNKTFIKQKLNHYNESKNKKKL